MNKIHGRQASLCELESKVSGLRQHGLNSTQRSSCSLPIGGDLVAWRQQEATLMKLQTFGQLGFSRLFLFLLISLWGLAFVP